MDSLPREKSPKDQKPPFVTATHHEQEVHVAEIPESSHGSPKVLSTPGHESNSEAPEPKSPVGATIYPLPNVESGPDIPVVRFSQNLRVVNKQLSNTTF